MATEETMAGPFDTWPWRRGFERFHGFLGGEVLGHIVEAAIDGSTLTVPVVPFEDAAGTQGLVDSDNPLSCLSENGLIGASLLKEAVWQIDYTAEEVTIAPSTEGLDHIDGAIALDFTFASLSSPSPLPRFGAGDGELVFLLDTGSDGCGAGQQCASRPRNRPMRPWPTALEARLGRHRSRM